MGVSNNRDASNTITLDTYPGISEEVSEDPEPQSTLEPISDARILPEELVNDRIKKLLLNILKQEGVDAMLERLCCIMHSLKDTDNKRLDVKVQQEIKKIKEKNGDRSK